MLDGELGVCREEIGFPILPIIDFDHLMLITDMIFTIISKKYKKINPNERFL